MKKFDQ